MRTQLAKQMARRDPASQDVLPVFWNPLIHISDICGTMLGRDRLPPVQMISSQLEDVCDQQFDILHCSVLRNAVFLICCNHWYSCTGQEWDRGLSTLTELPINFDWLFYDDTVIKESDNLM